LEEDEFELEAAKMPTDPSERKTITPVGSGALARRWSRVGIAPKTSAGVNTDDGETRTPSQQESELRERIQAHCKGVDALFFDRAWGETNKRVLKTFGQSRQTMTLDKLVRVMEWLEEMYPISISARR